MDAYIQKQSEDVREVLESLRQTIRDVAPLAEESLVYHLPAFKYKGHLVGFAVMKQHLSFFIMSPRLAKDMKDEITKTHTVSGATIHFSVANPLPSELVKKIVTTRLHENETRLSTNKSNKL